MIFGTISLILAQSAFFPVFLKSGLNPNLFFALIFTIYNKSKDMGFVYTLAFFGGILLDIISFSPIGLTALSLTLFITFCYKFQIKRSGFYIFAFLVCLLYQVIQSGGFFAVPMLYGSFFTVGLALVFSKF